MVENLIARQATEIVLSSYDGRPRLFLGEVFTFDGDEYVVIALVDECRSLLAKNVGPRLQGRRPTKH